MKLTRRKFLLSSVAVSAASFLVGINAKGSEEYLIVRPDRKPNDNLIKFTCDFIGLYLSDCDFLYVLQEDRAITLINPIDGIIPVLGSGVVMGSETAKECGYFNQDHKFKTFYET